MKKQTAVEWLGYELNTKLFYNITPELWEQVNAIFEQAKAMEREQIVDAYWNGSTDLSKDKAIEYAKEFYMETYGGDK